MKKDGTVILLGTDEERCDALCKALSSLGHKNKCVGFTNSVEASTYLRDNLSDIFIVLQSTGMPGIEIANTRNMVYLHEAFDSDKLPYMLLILTPLIPIMPGSEAQHTFVHCYYKESDLKELTETLSGVLHFWQEQIFPPKVKPLK